MLAITDVPFSQRLAVLVSTVSSPVLFLNSFLTPLIFCVRGKAINRFVKEQLGLVRPARTQTVRSVSRMSSLRQSSLRSLKMNGTLLRVFSNKSGVGSRIREDA